MIQKTYEVIGIKRHTVDYSGDRTAEPGFLLELTRVGYYPTTGWRSSQVGGSPPTQFLTDKQVRIGARLRMVMEEDEGEFDTCSPW